MVKKQSSGSFFITAALRIEGATQKILPKVEFSPNVKILRIFYKLTKTYV